MASVDLQANAVNDDGSDNTSASYSWTNNDASVISLDINGNAAKVTALAVGATTVVVTATDPATGASVSSEVTVTVTATVSTPPSGTLAAVDVTAGTPVNDDQFTIAVS